MSFILLILACLVMETFQAGGAAYNYKHQGDDWEGLCKTGTSQSPIDIPKYEAKCDKNSKFSVTFSNQESSNLNVKYPKDTDHGHNIQVDMEFSILNAFGKEYKSIQFHLHTPSEHTIQGKQYDVEMHIVHKSGDELGVLGILFDLDSKMERIEDTFFDNSRFDISSIETPLNKITPEKLMKNIFDQNVKYYTYTGSLTTPPCSEGVNFLIIAYPMAITQGQLDEIQKYFKKYDNYKTTTSFGNNRKVQALNGRVVQMGGTDCDTATYAPSIYYSFIALLLIFIVL